MTRRAGVGLGMLLVAAGCVWWTAGTKSSAPIASQPPQSTKSPRTQNPRPPIESVRTSIKLAAAQANWDRMRFKDSLQKLSLDEIRSLLNDAKRRPEGLRDGGWLAALDWHAAGEAYLLGFERYAELAFEEAIRSSTSDIVENIDPGLIKALLRGGGRGDGPFAMKWVEQTALRFGRPEEGLVDDEIYRTWFRAVSEGWEERHPGEALQWIFRHEGWHRTSMLCGLIDGLPSSTDWPSFEGRFAWLDGQTPGPAGDRQRFLVQSAVAARWFAVDPARAKEWARGLPGFQGREILPQQITE